MSLYVRRGVHGQVVEELGRRIAQGLLAPGELIDPVEVEKEIGVSRTVVREAVKVLASKGLIDALPRRGTYVLPRDRWNLLDADVMRWRHTGDSQQDMQQLDDLNELRALVEPFGARIAAQRRSDSDLAELDAAMKALEKAGGIDQHVAADLRFHRAVLAATHNELLARLDVVLESALRLRDALAFAALPTRAYLDLHRAVLDAVRAQHPAQAEQAMTHLLHEAAADTARLGLPGKPKPAKP